MQNMGSCDYVAWTLLLICLQPLAFVSCDANLDTTCITPNNPRRKLDDIAGSINIDCGISDDFRYTDAITGIQYVSDREFIGTGISKNVSSNFTFDSTVQISLTNVRTFPEGNRNCYNLRPREGRSNIYLIRASFLYGNYDEKNELPQFDLYVGVNFWDSVKFDNASHVVFKEIAHVSVADNIYVCLVSVGKGTPFISALELRHSHNSTYTVQAGSLVLHQRLNFGSTSNLIVRYHDDVYDRIWLPYNSPHYSSITTPFTIDTLNTSDFNLPSKVMSTAILPLNHNDPLTINFDIGNPALDFYIYLHFAELEILQPNQHREFNIELNGNLLKQAVVPMYLRSSTIRNPQSVRGSKLSFSLYKSVNSTLPPILNAMEIYVVRDFLHASTNEEDVAAVNEIKSSYTITEAWQGDPCAPVYSWQGLNCSYSGYDPPRITSLNLSSKGLTGRISPSLSNLKSLQNLDLSNNSLTGAVPEFLSQLPNLRTLNLQGNKLSGSVPWDLIERSNNGSLSLSLGGNPELCLSNPCKEESRSTMVPIIAIVVALIVIVIAFAILWSYKRKKATPLKVNTHFEDRSSLKSNTKRFTYVEIVTITSNFTTLIGKGTFGTVYLGYLVNGMQVAVKMFSPSSNHGFTEFQTEAELLMRVHHRNLASFIGYCDEGDNIGIIFEYMSNGNLSDYLHDTKKDVLNWKQRLQIALDAAQGLEYLHNGCKPPIVHRDVKGENILLNKKLQAKIADFGFSKPFPAESGSHLSTGVAGTVGYVDPEYYTSNRLTQKSDVYSFGVVLLELVTGQPAIIRNLDEPIHIVRWVSPFVARGDIENILDPRLKGNVDKNSVWRFIEVAMSCVPSISIQRPTMSDVVMELKDCLDTETAQIGHDFVDDGGISRSESLLGMNIVLDHESELGPEAR